MSIKRSTTGEFGIEHEHTIIYPIIFRVSRSRPSVLQSSVFLHTNTHRDYCVQTPIGYEYAASARVLTRIKRKKRIIIIIFLKENRIRIRRNVFRTDNARTTRATTTSHDQHRTPHTTRSHHHRSLGSARPAARDCCLFVGIQFFNLPPQRRPPGRVLFDDDDDDCAVVLVKTKKPRSSFGEYSRVE